MRCNVVGSYDTVPDTCFDDQTTTMRAPACYDYEGGTGACNTQDECTSHVISEWNAELTPQFRVVETGIMVDGASVCAPASASRPDCSLYRTGQNCASQSGVCRWITTARDPLVRPYLQDNEAPGYCFNPQALAASGGTNRPLLHFSHTPS